VSVWNLRDGKPHYSWLPLKANPEFRDRSIRGEIRIRVRWIIDTAGYTGSPLDSGISVNVSLNGIGISIIEASATKLPRELMHLLLDEISVDFERGGPDDSARFKLKSMQIDNQLITSMHSVAFAHAEAQASRKDVQSEDSENSSIKPILEVR